MVRFLCVLAVMSGAGAADACEPGGSLAGKAFRGGSFDGKVAMASPFAPAFAMGMSGAAFQGQKALLAQQAAIRQAQRMPMKLAKAYQARQEMLAQRAVNRELIAKRYQEYRIQKGLDSPILEEAPQLAGREAPTVR